MGQLRVRSTTVDSLLSDQEGDLRTLSDMEKALEEAKQQLADQALTKLLERLGPEDGSAKACPRCGRSARVNRKAVPRAFESMSGRHRIERNYHYCDACRAGFYPRDIQLGLPPEGDVTYELERRILDLAVNSTYRECVERFRMHYGREFSENLFRKVVERVGKRMGEADEQKLYELAAPPPLLKATHERLTVITDGSMLPGLGGLWREAKLAVLLRNDEKSPSRIVAHWGCQEGFRAKLKAAMAAERAVRYEEIVWIGDGAKGNWTLSYELAVGRHSTEILDWIHAVENGVKCGRALLGEQSPWLELWKRRIEQLLGSGKINTLIHELMDCMESVSDAGLEAINALVGYYRNNASRMNYPEYRQRGLPIGSGQVESAHRYTLQRRMKLSGQHWSDLHGQRMVALRALYKTTGPENLYDVIHRGFLATKLRKPTACLTRPATARRMPLPAAA